jgi:hypothetical protein
VLAWMRQDSVRVAMREAAWLRSLLREYFPAALGALSTEPETRTAVGDGLVELDRKRSPRDGCAGTTG